MTFNNGVNLQPSYYNNGEVNFAWDLMQRHLKIKTVRIEIEPDKTLQARGWIQQACGNGYKVIATYHKDKAPLGTDNRSELTAAANWWAGHYTSLLSAPAIYTIKAGDTLSAIAARYYGDPSNYPVIFQANRQILPSSHRIRPGQTLTIPARSRSFTINIMNEWGSHRITARDFVEAYNAAIGTVRGVCSGPLIIDVPGYAQETAVAASAVKGFNTGGARITDTNIILSVHVYRQAYVQQKRGSSSQRSGPLDNADLDDLASAGRPCIIGEFGTGDSGPANWGGLVDHAKSLGWPVLGWAWNGDGGTMNMVAPSWSGNPNPPSFTISSYFSTIYSKL